MSLLFKSRRVSGLPSDKDIAARVAAPICVADVLSPAGERNAVAQATADRAQRDSAALEEGLRHRLGLPNSTLAKLEAGQIGTTVVDPFATPPDPRLIQTFGPQACLKHRVIPWQSVGGRVTVIAASHESFLRVRDALTVLFGPVHLAIVPVDVLDATLSRTCHGALMENAEYRTPEQNSCRNWNGAKAGRYGLAVLFTLIACFLVWPQASFLLLCGWAVLTLVLNTALKLVSALFYLFPKPEKPVPANPVLAHLPIVTILVPLFRERDIAGALVARLSKLDYPTEKLDVCLVLEADDGTTQEALAATKLPFWMRAIKVPLGSLQTKPRALNYALSFAKGSIIGVYDAEDAPAPDQITKVVHRFAERTREVACLQGRLDFYNANSNWLARCFAAEYASWFRIILPGLERLGLAIPLGGTTLFFRRDVLEDLGGWDAHNVTEDADLGIRLARQGYRTEIIDTVTQEEANARAWPWVKQRSRWLKGYAITYKVHMRNPVKLWRELGAWRFFGVQLLFAGTISQFLLAPLLWSFWLMLVGVPHPLDGVLPQPVAIALAATFVLSELIGIGVACLALNATGKPRLMKWTPTLHFYFPLAAIAAYKGVFELATRPFYWDKTAHGIFLEHEEVPLDASPRIPPPLHQVAAE